MGVPLNHAACRRVSRKTRKSVPTTDAPSKRKNRVCRASTPPSHSSKSCFIRLPSVNVSTETMPPSFPRCLERAALFVCATTTRLLLVRVQRVFLDRNAISTLHPAPVCRHCYRTRQPLLSFGAHGRWYGSTRPAATAAIPGPGKNYKALYTAPIFSWPKDSGVKTT